LAINRKEEIKMGLKEALKMKQIIIETQDGVILIDTDGRGNTDLKSSNVKKACPYCNQIECYANCDQSTYDDSLEDEDEMNSRMNFNQCVDGVESLLLAMVSNGVQIDSKVELAVNDALEGIENNT
jgi:hypothetical protein